MLLYSITIANFQKKNNFDKLCFDDHKIAQFKEQSRASKRVQQFPIGGVTLDFKVSAITEAKNFKLRTVKVKRFKFLITIFINFVSTIALVNRSIFLQHQSKQFVKIRVLFSQLRRKCRLLSREDFSRVSQSHKI